MTAGTSGSTLAGNFALICDCDGVLIDSEAVAARMLVHETRSAAGPAPTSNRWCCRCSGCASRTVLQARRRSSAGRSTPRRSTRSAARWKQRRCRRRRSKASRPRWLQVPLTQGLREQQLSPYVETVLERTGLVRFFGDRLFCADTVPNPKPAPDVYLAAAQDLGSRPRRCLVVEDSVTGVTAASAAGMTVLGFIGGGHASDAQIDALHASWRSVTYSTTWSSCPDTGRAMDCRARRRRRRDRAASLTTSAEIRTKHRSST